MSRRGRTAACLAALTLGVGSVLLAAEVVNPEMARTKAAPRPEPYDTTTQDVARIAVLLRSREAAVADGDLDGFLATVDPEQPRLRQEQQALFENLAELKVTDFRYEVVRTSQYTPGFVPGDDPLARLPVLELTGLPRITTGPVTNETSLTFVRRDGDWYVGAERLAPPNSLLYGTQDRPWLGEPIKALRRGATTVLMAADENDRLYDLSVRVRDDLERVSRVLAVPQPDRLLVDATENGEPTLLNDETGEEALGVAVPLFSLSEGKERRVGMMVKLNPSEINLALLDPAILTHELTHVLLDRQGSKAPLWVSEGIAEWMGQQPFPFRDIDLFYSIRDAALALDELPRNDEFYDQPAVSYAISHAAATFLVQQRDISHLVAFMAAYREGDDDIDAATPALLEKFYGLDESEVLAGAQRLIERTQ